MEKGAIFALAKQCDSFFLLALALKIEPVKFVEEVQKMNPKPNS